MHNTFIQNWKTLNFKCIFHFVRNPIPSFKKIFFYETETLKFFLQMSIYSLHNKITHKIILRLKKILTTSDHAPHSFYFTISNSLTIISQAHSKFYFMNVLYHISRMWANHTHAQKKIYNEKKLSCQKKRERRPSFFVTLFQEHYSSLYERTLCNFDKPNRQKLFLNLKFHTYVFVHV